MNPRTLEDLDRAAEFVDWLKSFFNREPYAFDLEHGELSQEACIMMLKFIREEVKNV